MTNPSRITISAERPAVVFAAAEAQHRRMIAARISLHCADAIVNRTVLKLAAEGIAARVVAAQLPFWITPEGLTDALVKHSIPADAAAAAVAAISASNSIRPEAELPHDRFCSELLTSHLMAVPYFHGLKRIEPTADLVPTTREPLADTSVPAHENIVGDDEYPPIPTAAFDDVEASS
jgi:hypothetical protein